MRRMRVHVEDKWGVLTWQRTLQPDLAGILPTPPAPRPESAWFRVFTRGELSPGHDAGVDSSDHRYDWLTTESDAFVLRYPGSGCWESVAIQRGVPTAQIPRPLYWDLSAYSHLVASVSGKQGAEPLEVIRPSPENDRLYRPVDPDDPEIVALAESIVKFGVREPLVVTALDAPVRGTLTPAHRRVH
ncbi:MAG: hypothetical protein KAY37_08275 [Phycisphaerae bacterium]|nr:hypothetical protein [Phycisphaerae bacterium]